MRRLGPALAANFGAERSRWPLWLPVALGVGIAVYFMLPVEPPQWVAALAVLAAGWFGIVFRARSGALLAILPVFAVAVGFGAAQYRTAIVMAPVLANRTAPAAVTGRVAAVEDLPAGRRLLLEKISHDRLSAEETPARVRIRASARGSVLAPGDWVAVRAVLTPPFPPVAPGAFDFQRHAYFAGIGAYGFAVAIPRRVAPPEGADPRSLGLALERFRDRVTQLVLETLEGAQGAIAAALLTGKRWAIPRDVLSAMRDSGLAHLLAISGLHVGLLAAIIFFGLRAILALAEPLALRYPIKKWAAIGALCGAFGYLLLSGAPIPTQRAFLMLALVLVAVLLDRTAISMRLVAWAALAVLLLSPESLLSASFQMSFGAVIALIAAYEVARGPLTAWRLAGSRWRGVPLYLAGVAITTIVASMATAPFAAFHFNRLAAYGLAANLLAVPITGLWIMPWAVVGLAAMPFGLEAGPLGMMGIGIDAVIAVARTVAAWPGAVVYVPAFPPSSLALIAAGGLWLCLWRRRWRLIGVPIIAAGIAVAAAADRPDVLVSSDGALMAVRDGEGRLVLSSYRVSRFTGEAWLQREGQTERPIWPGEGANADGSLRCDSLGCVYRAKGHTVALARSTGALGDDCTVAEIVVSAVPVRRRCASAKQIIDRFDLWRNGAHSLWLKGGGVRVESARMHRGMRPWVIEPKPRPKRPVNTRNPD